MANVWRNSVYGNEYWINRLEDSEEDINLLGSVVSDLLKPANVMKITQTGSVTNYPLEVEAATVPYPSGLSLHIVTSDTGVTNLTWNILPGETSAQCAKRFQKSLDLKAVGDKALLYLNLLGITTPGSGNVCLSSNATGNVTSDSSPIVLFENATKGYTFVIVEATNVTAGSEVVKLTPKRIQLI